MTKNAGAPVRAGDSVPLHRQIACVERELRMRRRVYPRLVAEERMTAEDAVRENWELQAALETLKSLVPDLFSGIKP